MEKPQAKNVAEFYKEVAGKHKDHPAFLSRKGKAFEDGVTYQQLYEQGLELATALIDLGVKARDHLGLFADNRLEWAISSCAVQLCGAADVPRGTDVTDNDICYILSHSDAKIVFVEHTELLERILKNKSKFPNVTHFILMDPASRSNQANVLSMQDLIEKGKQLRAKGNKQVEEHMEKIQPDDIFTLIYTSGTTGVPKGVMLTHANIISQINNIPVKLLTRKERMLSILPIWHIFERCFEMCSLNSGAATYYTNIRSIRDDMQQVRPTVMGSAPRLWENVYLGISKKIEASSPVKKALFKAAYFCSSMFNGSKRFLACQDLDLVGRNPIVSLLFRVPFHFIRTILFAVPFCLLDFIVLSKIRAATGGKLRYSISGGGALPNHVDLFFNNIGLAVLEGYGMTETAPVLAVRKNDDVVIGSVGPVCPGTELRLVDIATGNTIYPPTRGVKGEIHVKGPQVMKGYYKNPEATKKVLQEDGWLNTGDLGVMTYNNALKIVGRSKETIVLLGGENVEPVPIEGKLLQSPLISNCMVTGQDKKHLTCLVVPDEEKLSEHGSDYAAIVANPQTHKDILNEIKSLITAEAGFKAFEKVLDCRLVPKPFTVGDELTNIFKLKRHVITEKYQDLIDSMYK